VGWRELVDCDVRGVLVSLEGLVGRVLPLVAGSEDVSRRSPGLMSCTLTTRMGDYHRYLAEFATGDKNS
jgi:hypothetical protein